jgi:uncharacterized protein YggT (Ycf19 family)
LKNNHRFDLKGKIIVIVVDVVVVVVIVVIIIIISKWKKNYYYYRRKTIIFLKIKKYKNLGRQIKFIINIININVGSSIAAIPNAFGS